jgi:hypothetical protein
MNTVEISLFGLSGGAELGAKVTAIWMVISMLVICALGVALMLFRSVGIKLVLYAVLFISCLLFQPWLCFVPSAASKEDSEIREIDDMFFTLGCCWLATFLFVFACHRIPRWFAGPPKADA